MSPRRTLKTSSTGRSPPPVAYLRSHLDRNPLQTLQGHPSGSHRRPPRGRSRSHEGRSGSPAGRLRQGQPPVPRGPRDRPLPAGRHGEDCGFSHPERGERVREEQGEVLVPEVGAVRLQKLLHRSSRVLPALCRFGIVHQVNLEYLARVVFDNNGLLYPDSVVGTDSHTTMINGLGVVGWGVGGIEAEAVMLGQCTSMVLPEVIGFKLTGELKKTATATDLVLLCTQMLRKKGVVDKFVEFYGPGVKSLSLADRATISNMAPEYGATIGLFPVDEITLGYLRQTGRTEEKINVVKSYLSALGLFKDYEKDADLTYSSILELDLSTV